MIKKLIITFGIALSVQQNFDIVKYEVDPPVAESVFQSGTDENGLKVYFTPEFIINRVPVEEGDIVYGVFAHDETPEGIFMGVYKWPN